jgi:phage terminase large subunit-like protein
MSTEKLNLIRYRAENDLAFFIRLVDKERLLGHIHEDVIDWWTRPNAKSHQLLLLPRDHMKSALVAFRVAQALAKDPTLRVLYISSTSNLAEKQLGFIKNILTSETFRRYWPDHVNKEEGKREKWTTSEIALDHPDRKRYNVRDPSIFCAGLTTSVTGLHCDISVLDDVVVFENAYTGEGRDKVQRQYSLLSSIEGAEARQWVVGTRYHPKDLYNSMIEMEEEVYNQAGEIIANENVYEVYQEVVEDAGDGTGTFLWPRQQRESDGKWFGFNRSILAKKRAQYADRMQYRAQYYNNPTDPDNRLIDYDRFQYFDSNLLTLRSGTWYYKGKRLNLAAAIDFAFSTKKRADFTAIVVVGIDAENNIYVLDIVRFKTDKISDYYKELMRLLNRWSFRKLRAECTAAQSAIVKELKTGYLRPNGISLKIDEFRPNRHEGSKEERMAAILEPRYDSLSVYHGRGGNWQVLEEELVSTSPPHDDVKDALASAIEIVVKPTEGRGGNKINTMNTTPQYHPRFGGRSF